MRVLLVNPATRQYCKPNGEKTCKNATMPLGLAFLCSYARKGEHEISILDVTVEGYDTEIAVDKYNIRYGLSIKEINNKIQQYSPDVVGISCLQSMRYNEAVEVCSAVKKVSKDIITVMGGSHVTGLPDYCMKNDDLDYAIIGEGEEPFLKLLNALENRENISNIPGIVFKKGKEIIFGPSQTWIEDLDTMPIPAWDELPMEKYFSVGIGPSQKILDRYAILVTSRGCPHRCYYCPSWKCWGTVYRSRSPQSVMEEIEMLNKEYNIDNYLFEEHNFITNKDRVLKICELIMKKNMKIRWSAPNGMEVQCLDKEYIETMAAAGCDTLHLAIETTCKKVYSHLDKRIDYDHVKQVINWGRACGMKVATLFMLGFPEETIEDMRETLSYAESLNADYVHFFIATPLPGTLFYEKSIREGWMAEPKDFSNLRYCVGNIRTNNFSPADVEKLRRDGWLKIMENKISKNDVWNQCAPSEIMR